HGRPVGPLDVVSQLECEGQSVRADLGRLLGEVRLQFALVIDVEKALEHEPVRNVAVHVRRSNRQQVAGLGRPALDQRPPFLGGGIRLVPSPRVPACLQSRQTACHEGGVRGANAQGLEEVAPRPLVEEPLECIPPGLGSWLIAHFPPSASVFCDRGYGHYGPLPADRQKVLSRLSTVEPRRSYNRISSVATSAT